MATGEGQTGVKAMGQSLVKAQSSGHFWSANHGRARERNTNPQTHETNPATYLYTIHIFL